MYLHEVKQEGFYYYTYKIVSVIPDKPYYYYGIHKTDNLEDGYFGGGRRLQSTIKKYGKENFEKTILGFFDNYAQLLEEEISLVGDLYKTDPWCLNLVSGGGTTSGFHRAKTEEEKRHLSEYNKKHSRWAKENAFLDPDFRRKHKEAVSSLETRKKMSESHKGPRGPMNEAQYQRHLEICHSEKWRRSLSKSLTGKLKTQEHRKKLSLSLQNQRKYKCPYCGLETIGGNYKRWHGENCKMKDYGQKSC